jgi:hypothetical protein
MTNLKFFFLKLNHSSIIKEKCRPNLRHLDVEVADEICLDENVCVNKYISRYLEEFQVEGVKFLYKAYKNKKGCSKSSLHCATLKLLIENLLWNIQMSTLKKTL